jgi:hypothetical protein
MRRGRERRHRFIPGVKSRRAKRIYMGTLRTTAVRMDNTEERPSLLDRFLLTRSVSTTCTATSGSGLKTVGTETTTVRPRTAPRGEVASVRAVFFVAGPQTAVPGTCALPAASGTPPALGTAISGSVPPGHFFKSYLLSSLPL